MGQEEKEKAEKIAEEHSLIRGRLAELSSAGSNAAVLEQLGSLVEILRSHFALEEDLADVEELNPRANLAGLRKVFEEHGEILAKADALLTACRSDAPVTDGVASFVAFLRDHEERETDATFEAVWTDLGGQG